MPPDPLSIFSSEISCCDTPFDALLIPPSPSASANYPMFYDLNVPWPIPLGAGIDVKQSKKASKKKGKEPVLEKGEPDAISERMDPMGLLGEEKRANLERRVEMLIHLGYSVLSFSHTVHTRIIPGVHTNPFPPTSPAPFPHLDSRTVPRPKRHILQLHRLTLVLDEDSFGGNANHGITNANVSLLSTFDILAVRPLTETAFQSACLSLTALAPHSIDIISLDLASSPRLPFHLKRSTVSKALEGGAVFEICYTGAVSGEIGERRNLIAGAREVIRITGGKGVVLSGEVEEMMGLRGPFDVINL
uniref:Uncharacterized protein n=1 Tax=Bartheletia paradoxa TaxID=669517 RepID=A0A2D0XHQ0_9BASI|nr:hypothetical protein SPAR05921 [Bartheletia paradoxa]